MSLHIDNLSYSYRNSKNAVLENISCSFEPGKFYGIFGANGSGKSTLLKILSGEIAVKAPVTLDDKALQSYSSRARARKIAYACQANEAALPFTARECIKLGRYAWNDDNPELIDSLLKEWGAEALADRFFTELSGGEQQRIKLLRILAQDTPYILLDEPASSLDWSRQLELYEKLRKIAHQQNRAVIMVAHDLYAAPAFIDRMLILSGGSLAFNGDPSSEEALDAVNSSFGKKCALSRQDNKLIIDFQAN